MLWASLSALPLDWLPAPAPPVQALSPLETTGREEGGERLGEAGRIQEGAGRGNVSLEE